MNATTVAVDLAKTQGGLTPVTLPAPKLPLVAIGTL
jgi:hypothetical protein